MSEELLRIIIGDIASNTNYGVVMKKWREMFGLKQGLISNEMRIKQSVISDYENERCKNPGIKFVRDYSISIIKLAKQNNYKEYKNALKRLKINPEKKIMESFAFKKNYSNKDFLKILKATQLIMPNEDVNVKSCAFFIDNASKLLTNRPTYNLLKNMKNEGGALFVFLNVKSGNIPVMLINALSGNKKNDFPAILLFQSEKLKLSWIAKKLAKSKNISIIWSKKSKEELLSIIEKL